LKSSEVFVGTIAFQLNLCEAREIIDQYLKKNDIEGKKQFIRCMTVHVCKIVSLISGHSIPMISEILFY